MNKQLSIGYSTCPNDTYIFDALVHQKFQHNYHFDVVLEDVESLNQRAFKKELDISKISIHAWFHMIQNYDLLSSGAALGSGCGPLFIGKSEKVPKKGKIALPGSLTTAALLFQIAVPGDFEYVQMTFDRIIPAIQNDEVDGGVIIHESRFTYQNQGLVKKLDLGEWWEKETGCAIPLGGIMINRSFPLEVKKDINQLIRSSIVFADENPSESIEYIKDHAKELDDNVIQNHIQLYVNEYSKALKNDGVAAIQRLHEYAVEAKIIQPFSKGEITDLIIQQ